MYQKYVKRGLDLIGSLLLIIILSPVLLVVAALVRLKLGSPVLFRQERPGYQQKVFSIYKFRTMTDGKDEEGNLLPDEKRLTRFGKFLRSTSLDELPELFNILKGEMSFVGPRPLLARYLKLYSKRQSKRHDALPGLTGWAQVNGRNAISWEEKFEFDVEYIENISFFMDAKIFVMTILKVLQRAGISAYNSATMEAFEGTKRKRFGKSQKNKTVRILFSSIGDRVELVQTFLYAAGNLGIRIRLYGADASDDAPAVYRCHEKRKTVPPEHPNYVKELLAICKKESIDVLIPTKPKEILLLSHYRFEFERLGTEVLVSEEEKIDICSNKKWMMDFIGDCGVSYPKPVHRLQDYQGTYPCMLEILDENDSIVETRRIYRERDLAYIASQYDNYLVRPFVDGKVYVVDVFCDLEGRPIYITPRAQEEVEPGEIARFKIIQDDEMIDSAKKIVKHFKPIGPLTIKFIRQKGSNQLYAVRIEPYFDYSASVSIKAGADAPMALYKLMFGEEVTYQEQAADDGVIFSRFAQSICLDEKNGNLYPIKDIRELQDMDEDMEAVLFDMGDTLYSEKEFMRSGYRAVAKALPQVKQAFNKLCVAFEEGKLPIETVLESEGIYSEDLVESCLEIYDHHDPTIELYEGVEETFKELHKKGKFLAILTDGDPEMERKKIKALGLESMVDEILITDELAGNGSPEEFHKPNDLAFLIMRKRLDVPCRNMAYVGDDRNIDFVGPGKLGIRCYWYQNEDGLYEFK